MKYKIWWNQSIREVASLDEVATTIDDLHLRFKDALPTLVSVEREPGGPSLSIGLGLDDCVLNYMGPEGDPPYYTSVGQGQADQDISFQFGGTWSEFPSHHALPFSVGRMVLLEFCATGERSDRIEWEEV
jgi:hypothetical protein